MDLCTYLLEKKLERNTVNATRVVLKMNNFNKISFICIKLFLGNSFRYDVRVFVDTDHGIVGHQFSEELVMVDFVDPDPTTFLFVLDLRLLHKRLDEILNVSLLVY